MSADKPKKFDETEKELEQYGSWVKGSSDDFEIENIEDDYIQVGDPENDLMTEEEEMLLDELENSESESESSFGDISFDEFEDLEDETDDTFGMEAPDETFNDDTSQTSDLSVKILQSIEKELVGLRNEVKDLKIELSHLQRVSPESPAITEELDQPTGGFFEQEDDDETIALTGDELDNILVSAEVEEETISDSEEPAVDDLIITEELDDFPEEFNESNILGEDELQDTEDLIKDTDLDNTLMDGLSLGADDPALAELAETSESFDIDGESFEVEEFAGIAGESFTVEEYTDSTAQEDPIPPQEEERSIKEPELEKDDMGFDEGEEIDITIDEEINEAAEVKKDSVPFENLEEIDLSSFDENLVLEEETDFGHVDLDDFSEEDDEITIDIEPEIQDSQDRTKEKTTDDLSIPDLDDILKEEPDAEEIILDEIIITDDVDQDNIELEVQLPDLDDIILEDSVSEDSFAEMKLPDMDEIILEESDNEEISLDEISIDEEDLSDIIMDEIELPDMDEIIIEENNNEEISLDEISIDEDDLSDIDLSDMDLPDMDEIILEENDNDEINLDEISIDDDNEEIILDEILIDEEEISEMDIPDIDEIILEEPEGEEIELDEISLDEETDSDEFTPEEIDNEEISLDEIVLDDEPDIDIELPEIDEDPLQDIELPDLDEIIIEDDNLDADLELPEIDNIVLDESSESSDEIEISLDEIIIDDSEEIVDIPDLDEIIIDDIEESVPDLDELFDESELSEIELPDMNEVILEGDLDLPDLDIEEIGEDPSAIIADDNIFGDDSESVDLDSLEQLAVEEDNSFTNELNDKVEEIREAALKGNVPEELKEEIKDILLYMDQLLESLPDEKIQEFARSEHFEVYKKIFEELGIKK